MFVNPAKAVEKLGYPIPILLFYKFNVRDVIFVNLAKIVKKLFIPSMPIQLL